MVFAFLNTKPGISAGPFTAGQRHSERPIQPFQNDWPILEMRQPIFSMKVSKSVILIEFCTHPGNEVGQPLCKVLLRKTIIVSSETQHHAHDWIMVLALSGALPNTIAFLHIGKISSRMNGVTLKGWSKCVVQSVAAAFHPWEPQAS